MNFDNDAPFNRIKGESKKALSAFMTYFQMGAARSLRDLLKKYQKQDSEYKRQEAAEQQANDESATEKPPTVSWWTLGNWSKNNYWQARITRHVEIDNEIALEQYRQRHMSEEEIIFRLSEQARADMADFAKVRTQADLGKLSQSHLVKKITAHYRQLDNGQVTGRITIDLHDAQKALELLGKHHGLFTDNVKVDWQDKLPEGLDPVTVKERLAALLAAAAVEGVRSSDDAD